MVPLIVVLALAYSGQLLERLERERERSEQLAVEAERRRIAWDLHDSAKQRIHAAHLILSAVAGQREDERLEQAIGELRFAGEDMESSLNELLTPLLEGRGLGDALRARARELCAATTAHIDVRGESAALPPFILAHAYRIASEALTNAIRHANAERILVRLAHTAQASNISRDSRKSVGAARVAEAPRDPRSEVFTPAEVRAAAGTAAGSWYSSNPIVAPPAVMDSLAPVGRLDDEAQVPESGSINITTRRKSAAVSAAETSASATEIPTGGASRRNAGGAGR